MKGFIHWFHGLVRNVRPTRAGFGGAQRRCIPKARFCGMISFKNWMGPGIKVPCGSVPSLAGASFLVGCLGMVAGALNGGDYQETWPQWRGPGRDGHYPGASWPGSFQSNEWNLQWSQRLDESYSSPVVDLSALYTTESSRGGIETVKAFERSTGRLLWSTSWAGEMEVPFFARSNGSWIRSTPAVHDGKLFVMGMQETLLCLDASTGEVEWKLEIPRELNTPEPSFGGVSSPLIDGDALFIQAAGGVLKVHTEQGRILWKSGVSADAMNQSPFSSPMMFTWNGARQLVALGRNELKALDPSSGEVLWQQAVPSFRGMNILTPTWTNNGVLTATYGGRTHFFKAREVPEAGWGLQEEWTLNFQGYMSSPVVVGSHAYVHGRSGRLVCMDGVSGEIRWTSTDSFGKYCSMITDGRRLLTLTSSGDLCLMDANPAEFVILDRVKISDEETWAHIGAADGQVFIRSLNQIKVFRWRESPVLKAGQSGISLDTRRMAGAN